MTTRTSSTGSLMLSLLVVLALGQGALGWNPDAGLVTSWTKQDGVNVSASSDTTGSSGFVFDGDDNTHWTSGGCLPLEYLPRPNVNMCLNLCQSPTCEINGADDPKLHMITDGNVYTSATINTGQNNMARLVLNITDKTFTNMSIWGVYNHGDTVLKVIDALGTETILRTFNRSDNYAERKIPMPTKQELVIMESQAPFVVKEISAFGLTGCHQRIVVDLGVPRRIGIIRTRHWAGINAASSVSLLGSLDGTQWDIIRALEPEALHAVVNRVHPPVDYRYIAIDYEQTMEKNYVKVYCWEIDAFDEFGKWGPPPTAETNPVSLRGILGVNGIWGWGHQTYSDSLAAGQGPTLYNKIASHARNYHNLNWDVKDPDNDPEFQQMGQGHGTNAHWWLNWDKEYSAWQVANLTVDTSIQFTNKVFPVSVWNTPARSAYHYGREFARHFGQQIGNHYVSAMEVGNEPWDYSADFYATVLEAMTAGVRDVDQAMDVLPGAFQADTIAPEEPTRGNYIGTRVRSAVAANISVINTHAYSFMVNESGVRIATYPEHPDSDFHSVRNIIRWRNVNTPGKPIWLTEWGWDADGGNESCAGTECVTQTEQALYGARGLFMVARLGVSKATWFFYANTDTCNTLFCRSGLTTSVKHHFSKKPVFDAFEAVLDKLGDSNFMQVISEGDGGYVYLFGTKGSVTRVVAWLPIDAADVTTTRPFTFRTELRPWKTWRLTGSVPSLQTEPTPQWEGKSITLTLTSRPLIVEVTVLEPAVIVG